MRTIDLQSWSRREHFEYFRQFDHPHFNMCANVDVTSFYPYVKQHELSLNLVTVYVVARAANAIPEFRMRIRDNAVIEHDVVHPSSTILADEGLFSFCSFEYVESYQAFAAKAAPKIAAVQDNATLAEELSDDVLFMTAIPWVSFTSFMHPMHLQPADSIPRFAWGKLFEDGESLKMPLSVQGHHSLMDGLHVGKYYAELQGYLNDPGSVLG